MSLLVSVGISEDTIVIGAYQECSTSADIINGRPLSGTNDAGSSLIIESEFGTTPFEIKLGQTVTSKSLSSIKNFMQEVDCSIGFVINNDEKVRL